jgi:hypothetical protein
MKPKKQHQGAPPANAKIASAKTKFLTCRITEKEYNTFKHKCTETSEFLRAAVNHYDEVNSFLNTLK